MPALQEWATGLIAEHVNRAMTFPSTIDISFIGDQVKEFARENNWPTGIATLELKTVHMPLWQTQACMPSVVLKPATWVDLSLVCDVHAMTYPLVMDPQRPHTMEVWQASLPVFDPGQVGHVIYNLRLLWGRIRRTKNCVVDRKPPKLCRRCKSSSWRTLAETEATLYLQRRFRSHPYSLVRT